MPRAFGRLFLCLAAPAAAVTLAAHEGDRAPPAREGFFVIAQQTAYQVDPIKIRLLGREDFKVHRIEVAAKLPAFAGKPSRREEQGAAAGHNPVKPNGKMTFFGRCTNDQGLWHWGDCARYEGSCSVDVLVGGRFEHDPSGLGRRGYTIRAVKDGNLAQIDADGKFFFFNGPPTKAQGAHPTDCPYRLVINTKGQNELVQAISMEPICKPAGSGRGRR